jgi:hemerythrin
MRQNKFALYDVHKANHEKLLDEIRYMMDAYDAGQCENCGMTLIECLDGWFHKHFDAAEARLQDLEDPARR